MDFDTVARRMFGVLGMKLPPAPPSGEPQAYSRITRTPIYIDPNMPEEYAGAYWPGKGIKTSPKYTQPGDDTIVHESAHDLWQRALLDNSASELAPKVPPAQRNTILRYTDIYPDPSDRTMANEGLGYGIGNPDATPYVQAVGSKIQSPELRRMLLRLHQNRISAQKLSGVGR